MRWDHLIRKGWLRMIAKKMQKYVEGSSVTRAMFEEGKRLAGIYGAENVYDFSLGNPSVEPPKAVKESMIDVLEHVHPNKVHGYMNNAGYEEVREAIAQSLNRKFDTHFDQKNIIMTVGAAGGLNVALKTIIDPGDEVIAFAPYFGEYNNYVANFDGVMVAISPSIPDFQPNLEELKTKITAKTKAVIVNTPNNPTGVIYSEETIQKLADILREKEKELVRNQLDGLESYCSGKTTLNYAFDRYISTKYDLKEHTRVNYKYMYNRFVRDTFGKNHQ